MERKNMIYAIKIVAVVGLVILALLFVPYVTTEYYTEKEPYIVEYQVPVYKTIEYSEPIYENVYIEVEYSEPVYAYYEESYIFGVYTYETIVQHNTWTEQVCIGQEIIGYNTWTEQVIRGYKMEERVEYKDTRKSKFVSECLFERIFA